MSAENLVYNNVIGYANIDQKLSEKCSVPNTVCLRTNSLLFYCPIEYAQKQLTLKIATFFKPGDKYVVYDDISESPFKSFSADIKCGNGHFLCFMNYQFYQNKFKCENCDGAFACHSGAFRCSLCKFDLCSSCYRARLSSSKKKTEPNENVINLTKTPDDTKTAQKIAIFATKHLENKDLVENLRKIHNADVFEEKEGFPLTTFLATEGAEKRVLLCYASWGDAKAFLQFLRQSDQNVPVVLLVTTLNLQFRQEAAALADGFAEVKLAFSFSEAESMLTTNEDIIEMNEKKKSLEELREEFTANKLTEFTAVVAVTDCVGDLRRLVAEKFELRDCAEKVILIYNGRVLTNMHAKLRDERISPLKSLVFAYENRPTLFIFGETDDYFVENFVDSCRVGRNTDDNPNEIIIRSVESFDKSLYYFEIDVLTEANSRVLIGVIDAESDDPNGGLGSDKNSFAYCPYEYIVTGGSRKKYGANRNADKSDFTVGVILDMDNRTLSFVEDGVNGKHHGIAFINLPARLNIALSLSSRSASATFLNCARSARPELFNLSAAKLRLFPRGGDDYFVVAPGDAAMGEVGFFAGDVCFCFRQRAKVVVAGLLAHPAHLKGRLLAYKLPFCANAYSTYSCKNIEKFLEIDTKAVLDLSIEERFQNFILGVWSDKNEL